MNDVRLSRVADNQLWLGREKGHHEKKMLSREASIQLWPSHDDYHDQWVPSREKG